MALLISGQINTNTHWGSKWYEFNPARKFTDWQGTNSQWKLQYGGWACHSLTLVNLYDEHTKFRNRWSASNCGFDLARYLGTTVYLQQHKTMDYIVYIDEEYSSTMDFLRQGSMHPMIMLTHPKTILIKSRERAGPRRTRKVWVPRPSWWENGWVFTTIMCKKGMFIFYAAFVDLDHPWVEPYIGSDGGTDENSAKWWNKTDWKDKWDTNQKIEFNATNQPDVQSLTDDLKAINRGPFMLRALDVNKQSIEQVTFFYKSKWRWGGNNITLKTICDPTKFPVPPL